MDDETPLNIRERTILTVFDHSGPAPRAVQEIEVLAVAGTVLSRTVRALGEWEATRHSAARAGGGVIAHVVAAVREDRRRTADHARMLTGWLRRLGRRDKKEK